MLATDLDTLLRDRREVREQARRYEWASRVPVWPDVKAAEEAILTLVTASLGLDLRDVPGKDGLAQVVSGAVIGYDSHELLETPRLIFSKFRQVYTSTWHPSVKARVINLTAPLDHLLLKVETTA